jgi:hypothetical protein
MAIRWRLGISTAVLLGAALPASEAPVSISFNTATFNATTGAVAFKEGPYLSWRPRPPPKTIPADGGFTFEVKGGGASSTGPGTDLSGLRAFIGRNIAGATATGPPLNVFPLPSGDLGVRVAATGEDAKVILANLKALEQLGTIRDPAQDPTWRAQPDSSAAAADDFAHLSGSFGATLTDPDQNVPVAGAYILYGPLSPTPWFDPGERPGDDQPPLIVRSDSKGAYSAPLGTLTGPIEIRVAKEGEERGSLVIADAPGTAAPR